MEYTFYCANRSHHILFFLVTMDEVTLFDLFDISNFAVLWYGGIERPPQFYFKLTGEEFMPIMIGKCSVFICINHCLYHYITGCIDCSQKLYKSSIA